MIGFGTSDEGADRMYVLGGEFARGGNGGRGTSVERFLDAGSTDIRRNHAPGGTLFAARAAPTMPPKSGPRAKSVFSTALLNNLKREYALSSSV